MKKIVFYQPIYNPQDRAKNSGTVLRPKKMKEAFSSLGYDIIDINGSFRNRRQKVCEVMQMDTIDFVYCESANVPFCFSGKSHFDFRPNADFRNLRRLKTKAKIGMYYRDLFWMETTFFKEFGLLKGLILKALYSIEFHFLIRILDVLFVQSEEMMRQFPGWRKYQVKFKLLPPACDNKEYDIFSCDQNIKLFYSGACDNSSKYNIRPLIDAAISSNVSIRINSDKAEKYYGDLAKDPKYKDFLSISSIDYLDIDKVDECFNVGVIWLSGQQNDICKYLPIKLFHYLSLGLPVIAKKETAAGAFIEKNKIGWTYQNYDDLVKVLRSLAFSKEELATAHDKVLKIRKMHKWTDRVASVVAELS